MALNIKDPEADRLARELAKLTGETLTDAVIGSLRVRLESERRRRRTASLQADVARIQRRIADLPTLDHRTADEILGYDENGLPT